MFKDRLKMLNKKTIEIVQYSQNISQAYDSGLI